MYSLNIDRYYDDIHTSSISLSTFRLSRFWYAWVCNLFQQKERGMLIRLVLIAATETKRRFLGFYAVGLRWTFGPLYPGDAQAE